ncbi:MAG: hypothetical protein IKQ59_03660, partial [Prevotella sp.]|nr:hypothetical protein [Prevotella sp.]
MFTTISLKTGIFRGWKMPRKRVFEASVAAFLEPTRQSNGSKLAGLFNKSTGFVQQKLWFCTTKAMVLYYKRYGFVQQKIWSCTTKDMVLYYKR